MNFLNNIKIEDNKKIYYIFMGSKYFPLDNFYEEDIEVEFDGLIYSNSEAAFQSAKLKNVNARKDFTEMYAGESKACGKNPYLTKLRPDWNEVKDEIMYRIVKDKLMRNPWIIDLLLSTGKKIIEEGNTWGDEYWGVNLETGKGRNQLGKILMQLREEAQNGKI